jgi:small subunit ribosomal protein S16
MVVIRLARSGSTHRPFYHVVVADSRARRDGSYIERLGFYNPVAKEGDEALRLHLDRVEHWHKNGAQMSDTAASLIKRYRKSLVAQPAA